MAFVSREDEYRERREEEIHKAYEQGYKDDGFNYFYRPDSLLSGFSIDYRGERHYDM